MDVELFQTTIYLFSCHTEYIIRSSFAILVHKTCEDYHDEGVQFVLKAAPQHQTSSDAYVFILKRVLILFQRSLRVENHDSDFKCLMFLKLVEQFMCICPLVSFKSLQGNHPFVC